MIISTSRPQIIRLRLADQRSKDLETFYLSFVMRWLLALTLSLPVALGYIYIKSQGIELYRSSASFRLIPPPAILNLQKVDRDQHVQGLVAKHLNGLNSQDLRLNVTQKIKILLNLNQNYSALTSKMAFQ